MDDKEKKIEELESRLESEIKLKEYWMRESSIRLELIVKLKGYIKKLIEDL